MDDVANSHGADAPGANMTVTGGVWCILGGAAALIIILGAVFRGRNLKA